MQVPVAQRQNVFAPTKPSAAARGLPQDLTLYVYHPDAKAATPDAGGGRKIRESKIRGIERQYSWLEAEAGRTDRDGSLGWHDAISGEALEAKRLLQQARSTLMVDDKLPTMPKPLGPRPADKGHATGAQWGNYRSVLPRRLGTTDSSLAGGDNRSLKAVKSWLRRQAKDHEAVLAAAEELWDLHRRGDAGYDPSHLVAGEGADGGGGGGDGGHDGGGSAGGGGGSAGGGGDGSNADAAKRRTERQTLGDRIEALTHTRIELDQRMWGAMQDHDTYIDLAGRRATVKDKIAALRLAMRKLAVAGASGAGPSGGGGADADAAAREVSESESESDGIEEAELPCYMAGEDEGSDDDDSDFGSDADDSSDDEYDGSVHLNWWGGVNS